MKAAATTRQQKCRRSAATMPHLQILTGVDDFLDAPLRLAGLADERLDVSDALALLAGDLRPVVRVRRVGQILVLLELLAHGVEQVGGGEAFASAADVALERQFLGAPYQRLDHRARGEVLEEEHLFLAVRVRDLE